MNPAYRQQAEMLNPQDVKSVEIDVSWLGAHGMSGNVMEWTADPFEPESTPNQKNPQASRDDGQRVARGGSWASYADFLLRTAQRIPYDPEYASSVIGFRCVLDMEGAP
jgi:formylglycine-generating enzyme required for sulfatase activity